MHQRHRHIVATVSVLFLIALSLWGGGNGETSLTGELFPQDETLFGGEGIREVIVGDYVLTSWSGFFFAKESVDHLSVAALTSPVLIRGESNTILLPVGWQWRTDEELTRVPGHFLTQYLKNIVPSSVVTMPIAFTTVDAWLVASVHPLMRDRALVIKEPEGVTSDDRMVRMMSFPQSDTLPEASAPFTVERWEIDIRDILKRTDDPRTLINQLIPHVVTMVQWFTKYGYPERAERYQKVLEDIIDDFRVFVSKESEAALQNLRTDGVMVRDVTSQHRLEPSSAEPLTVTPFDPEIVKQQIYITLRDMDALFTITTEIIPQSLSRAEIRGIVFGNHLFDFILDIDQQLLDAISMDGKLMAYPMGIEDFKNWIKDLE